MKESLFWAIGSMGLLSLVLTLLGFHEIGLGIFAAIVLFIILILINNGVMWLMKRFKK